MIDYTKIPHPIMSSLLRYQNGHKTTGGFLRAVIANDLISAVQRADPQSLAALPHIAAWAYNCLPSEAWGSTEAYTKWVERGEQ